MKDSKMPIENPMVVLREEFDDWAVLFDPDSGEAYGLNPVSVFIWKHLDGKSTLENIADDLGKECEDMPDDAMEYIKNFIDDLVEKGFAGYEVNKG